MEYGGDRQELALSYLEGNVCGKFNKAITLTTVDGM